MSRTPTQDKAIAWWYQINNLVPQLSTHPRYYFKHRDTGEVTSRMIDNLTKEYTEFKKEEKRKEKQA